MSAMACGHPEAIRNRSVETGVEFCGMCRLNEMLSDALVGEASWRARAQTAEAKLKKRNPTTRAKPERPDAPRM